MSAKALVIKNLTKQYPNGAQALSGINLSIEKGEFLALLGANGAGKTTTIHIVCGLLRKTTGYIEVFNINQDKSPNRIKPLIGLMGQEFNFNQFEPIEEVLINQAGYYGIGRKTARKRAHTLLKQVELFERRKQIVKSLSGGMKRRLMLARSLMHKPKILILDEPTAGVDIEIRRAIWQELRNLNASGVTIILTTHYLEEAEQLCKNIVIIDKGEVIAQSDMKTLLSRLDYQTLILESTHKLPDILKPDGFDLERVDDFSLRLILPNTENISEVFSKLARQHIMIKNIRQAQNRLESLFLNLTHKN